MSFFVVLVLGAATSSWQKKLSSDEMEVELVSTQDSVGQGLSLAILGGYRSIAANIIWLEMNGSWEQRNVDETITKIELATATDPRAPFFWVNGARIIANDVPAWVAEANGINPDLNPVIMRGLNHKFSTKALELIEDGLIAHPGNVDLMVDRAVIHWKKLEEVEVAAEMFLEIADLPNGPYFAARLYAEILVNLDQSKEALKYLIELYPTLPGDDLQAMKPFVAEKIRQLENEIYP